MNSILGYENLLQQLLYLIMLAIPVACVTWTITHEEILSEPRKSAVERSRNAKTMAERKFFYLFTCEYCFSHYVSLFFIIITKFRFLLNNYWGYVIALFALVFVANVYMSVFAYLRQNVKYERITASLKDIELKEMQDKEE